MEETPPSLCLDPATSSRRVVRTALATAGGWEALQMAEIAIVLVVPAEMPQHPEVWEKKERLVARRVSRQLAGVVPPDLAICRSQLPEDLGVQVGEAEVHQMVELREADRAAL